MLVLEACRLNLTLWRLPLLKKCWSCTLIHVFREINFVADCLAKEGLSLSWETVFFYSPPHCAELAFSRDLEGPAFVRLLGAAC
ncbi:hypothetical protein ACOSP7_028846 [Xanthoceras sorbifolium]